MESLVLSVIDVAEILGLSTATVYLLVRNNEIPHKKLRGRIIFHRETIEKWLATPTGWIEVREHDSRNQCASW